MESTQALPAIEVENVGKTYRMWASPAARLWVPLLYRAAGWLRRPWPGLAARLHAAAARRLRTHTALQSVSLRLLPGESLGIIGLNGSGKSTLLQIIAGVLPASSGRVAVHGRVAALLELGSGFNPELSGRENVYVNAAILGFARARVDALIEEIIAFAGIGAYIDEPVRTYSSGMLLRLAFAVQVHVEPDVLIVDEALAVGDAQFQAKAMARIEEVLARGTTLLYVGHDLNALRMFCQRALLLEAGRVVREGLPEDVIADYLEGIKRQTPRAQAPARVDDAAPAVAGNCIGPICFADGTQWRSVRYGEALSLALVVQIGAGASRPEVLFDILDLRGLAVSGRRLVLPAKARAVELRVGFPAELAKGIYRLRIRLLDAHDRHSPRLLAQIDGALGFEQIEDVRARFTGVCELPMQATITPLRG